MSFVPAAGLKARHYTIVAFLTCSGGASAPPCTALASPPTAAAATSLTVSAASSLSDVLTELAKRYEAATGDRIRVNAGGSNALARQILEGAPVDLFISADTTQMEVVARAGRLAAGSQVDLLSNQLVVVVPRDSGLLIAQARDLTGPGVRRVAMGQPESVPAGVYGRQWLERAGAWSAVQSKVVPLPTVRAALAAVREGRADAGIVYATDARTEPAVHVAYAVPERDAPRIVYPAAVVAGRQEAAARAFLSFLQREESRGIFEAAGFRVLARVIR